MSTDKGLDKGTDKLDALGVTLGNSRTVIETRIAFDTDISDLSRRLYIGLCGQGAWSHNINVSTREWATTLGVNADAIRASLRQLADRAYIERLTRKGARRQVVVALSQAGGS